MEKENPKILETTRETDAIYETLASICQDGGIKVEDKIHLLYRTLGIVSDLICASARLHFTTMFSKLNWIGNKLDLPSSWQYQIQFFRRKYERVEIKPEEQSLFVELGTACCYNLLHFYLIEKEIKYPLSEEASRYFEPHKRSHESYIPFMECIITDINTEHSTFTFIDEKNPDQIRIALYDIHDTNEIFTSGLLRLKKNFRLPVPVNLVDVSVTNDQLHLPSAIILFPDYLVDVTTIASALPDSDGELWLHVLNKLYHKEEKNLPILMGNLANQILDKLIYDPKVEFQDLIVDFFKSDPLAWAMFDDMEVKKAVAGLEVHFTNLQRIIRDDFPFHGIESKKIYLEPSFYSRKFGIQGRLDLLHLQEKEADIIELKSSKPFKPNAYGITPSHYHQALLYDMIFASGQYRQLKRNTFILYSILEGDNLKYANIVKSKQYELMKIRNELVLIDFVMAEDTNLTGQIIRFLKPENFQGLTGYALNNLTSFSQLYQSLSQLEKAYYHLFTRFIVKEQIYAKTGTGRYGSGHGQAALWLHTEEEKKEQYGILNYLTIIENKTHENPSLLRLGYTEYSARLSNFRTGDIVVLYPHQFNSKQILKQQIFKCNLISLDEEGVTLRLRTPQNNQDVFKGFEYWNLEQDVLDSSFKHMFKNLFYWMSAEEEKRALIMGQKKPVEYEKLPSLHLDDELTGEQKKIITHIFSCKDYYLLWGPPGTGKTSMVIKHLSRLWYEQSNEKILLVAYTNRAVDEICEALTAVGLGEAYIRIGSSFAVSENSKSRLLNAQIETLASRKDIIQLINDTRIFVSTISSLSGKTELFSLARFDTIVVDEAAQILEPSLCGLLTKFKKFILIGDHKQLPAVVGQTPDETLINEDILLKAGFTSTHTSLFERLFRQCVQKNWIHAFDIIAHQGRMHKDIMHFVNQEFYEGRLKMLPNLERLRTPLTIRYSIFNTHWLSQNRMIFINSQPEVGSQWKINHDEANKTAYVVEKIIEIYQNNKLEIHTHSIGVITPYRAQISLIKSKLPQHPEITVDTVERYQGGAKDIIILSLCTNKLSQLTRLVNRSDQGIDRKLNVALTRAKEQIIVIGHEEILKHDEVYNKLIQYSYKPSI